jgi:hypothetical protein
MAKIQKGSGQKVSKRSQSLRNKRIFAGALKFKK